MRPELQEKLAALSIKLEMLSRQVDDLKTFLYEASVELANLSADPGASQGPPTDHP